MIAWRGAVVSARDSAASKTVKCLGKVTGSEFLYLNNHSSLVDKQSCSQEGEQFNFSKSRFSREGNPWVKSSGLSPWSRMFPFQWLETWTGLCAVDYRRLLELHSNSNYLSEAFIYT